MLPFFVMVALRGTSCIHLKFIWDLLVKSEVSSENSLHHLFQDVTFLHFVMQFSDIPTSEIK